LQPSCYSFTHIFNPFFDVNKNLITGDITNSATRLAPVGAKYIRYSLNVTASEDISLAGVQIEEGTVSTAYESYTLKVSKDELNLNGKTTVTPTFTTGQYFDNGVLISNGSTKYASNLEFIGEKLEVFAPIFGNAGFVIYDDAGVELAHFTNNTSVIVLKEDYPTAKTFGISGKSTDTIYAELTSSLDSNSQEIFDLKSKNKIESIFNFVDGGYYDNSLGGSFILNSSTKYSLPKLINSDFYLKVDEFASCCCVLLDENGDVVYTIPNSNILKGFRKSTYPLAKYISVSTSLAGVCELEFLTNSKSNSEDIEDIKTSLEVLETAIPNFNFNVPKELHINNEAEFWFYDDSILSNQISLNKFGCKLTVSGSNISKRNSFGKIQYNAADRVLNFNVSKKIGATQSKEVTVRTKTKLKSTTKNVIHIGDSYLDYPYGKLGQGIMGYETEFATPDANTINFKGIRTNSCGKLGETYAGWSEDTFFRFIPTGIRDPQNSIDPSNVNSPFMFSTDNTVLNAKLILHNIYL